MSNINSAVVIARLLACEGFTDHVANQVERYWRRSSGLTDRQERQIVKLDVAIAEIANKLDVKERLALGRFIGLHKKMSFDTGLRIGMTAFVQQVAGRGDAAPIGAKRPGETAKNAGNSGVLRSEMNGQQSRDHDGAPQPPGDTK